MRNRHPLVDRHIRIETVRFIAEHHGHVPAQIDHCNVARTGRSMRSGSENSKASLREVLEAPIDEDGNMERCTGSRPKRLWIERVDRSGYAHDRTRTERFGRADQRAEVSRICQTVDDEHPAVQDRVGKVTTGNLCDHALRRFRGGDTLQYAALQFVHDNAAEVETCKCRIRTLRVDEDLEHLPLGTQCLFQEMTPLNDETLRFDAFGFVRQQTTESLHPIVAVPETGVAQTRAPRAVSTNLVNAAGSLTARSARILRSTCTPALFSPSIKRL
jgi:hypothetical protein